ncbi:MvaI/BcnI family restriction endonuclease [Bifidobacterium samirii]|uniref:MvaI/BcnI restriction endonuclease family n=1 Tax=Bifidobacterium samirii TaxID=2306974 RepID=A0A430FVG5_9BIFI|nr:MvaI/BcnI family restriction endonuclease [Bifidobacterium samirii]RSX57696.1 MvaI/BcnI restriction endonuclease family [Bifidobacterium samirii]
MRDTHDNEARQWYDTADIDLVTKLLSDAGASSVWVKRLVANNNSKQQVYLASDPSDLSFLPLGEPSYTPAKSQKRKAGNPVIQIPVTWQWVTPNGRFDAPEAKLCYYPQYPEVRFSGFLRGCKEAPNELLSETKRGHELNRCLFLGPVKNSSGETVRVVALVVGAGSPAAQYVLGMETFEAGHLCPIVHQSPRRSDEFDMLENALAGVVGRSITPWRLRTDGTVERPYIAPNAPGLTLEAELGVGENAVPGPDFDIWELKAIKQKSLDRRYGHKVTLFTPQPDLPETGRLSTVDFVLRYGHVHTTDENGEPTSYYFTSGDIQREGEDKPGAKLELVLEGFTDARHFDPNGMIALYEKGTRHLAAGWSFLKLLGHWQRKHNRAAYVPYMRSGKGDGTSIEFGPLITLGISTGFGMFLQAFRDGKAVYDPGDKATLVDGKWTPHARSQFRINLNDVDAIYNEVREIDMRDLETSD